MRNKHILILKEIEVFILGKPFIFLKTEVSNIIVDERQELFYCSIVRGVSNNSISHCQDHYVHLEMSGNFTRAGYFAGEKNSARQTF